MNETRTQSHHDRNFFWHDLARLSLLAGLVFLMFLVFNNATIRQEVFDLQVIRAHLHSDHLPGGLPAGIVLFLVCSGLLVGIGLPRLWVSVVAGAVYGPVAGSLLALVASLLGASITYTLGEKLLGGIIQKHYKGKISLWRERFRENAFWWVLYCRLFPFANASISGIICGSCKVPFKPFLAGSALGFIPLTVVFATFGSAGLSGNSAQTLLGFAFLLLTVGIRLIMTRYKTGKDDTRIHFLRTQPEQRRF